MNEDKTNVEQKYEKLKRISKENDSQYLRQISELEKQLAILSEKNQNLEIKIKDSEEKLITEQLANSKQSQSFKDQLAQLKRSSSTELERNKQYILTLENEKNELYAGYERDKILWDGKFKFLEQ